LSYSPVVVIDSLGLLQAQWLCRRLGVTDKETFHHEEGLSVPHRASDAQRTQR
jgi:hypothetical protein